MRGVEPNDIKTDELGDLRALRRHIVHSKGALPTVEYAKLKVMKELFQPDAGVTLSHHQMHKIFIHVKQVIGKLILKYTGNLPEAPNASELVSIAIQNAPR